MSIEEKAKEFAGFNFPHSRDLITTAKMNEKSNSFKAGAEWMIEKAAEWFKNQKEEIGISWFEDFEIRFRKAMEK